MGTGPGREPVAIEDVRVLFLTLGDADFLADSLLHGLRSLLGERAVDYPRQDILYRDIPARTLRGVHGRGFTLYGSLDDIAVDRVAALQRIGNREFDLVVLADIWQQYGLFLELVPLLGDVRVAVLDGEDWYGIYPYAPAWWRSPRLMLLPRAHTRVPYFKRELTRSAPGRGPGRRLLLPLRWSSIRPIAFSIPAAKVAAAPPPKYQDFSRHIVDPEVAARVRGARESYVFDDEGAYYDDLRASRFGVTTKRSGWDCLRHYELAASGCVLCFRRLEEKPPGCAPHGLHAGNCIVYRDVRDLNHQLSALDEEEVWRLQLAALRWARDNVTTRRAEAFLNVLGHRRRSPTGPTGEELAPPVASIGGRWRPARQSVPLPRAAGGPASASPAPDR